MIEKGKQKTETRTTKLEKLDVSNYSFDSLEKTRQDLTDLTKAFLRMEITETHFRAAVYAMNSITKLLVHEKVEKLEARLAALEKARKS